MDTETPDTQRFMATGNMLVVSRSGPFAGILTAKTPKWFITK